MSKNELHQAVKLGNEQHVRMLLLEPDAKISADINAFDRHGCTPLMCAMRSERVPIEIAKLLLERGASLHQESRATYDVQGSAIVFALAGGSPDKVKLLIDAGAKLNYVREHGYDTLIEAVARPNLARDSRLLDLLRLLIDNNVVLDRVTSYCESALRTLARVGRYDAVELLLRAGADASQLEWTSLMEAVAIGTLEDVHNEVERGADLEAKDWWSRTAFLIAIHTGDVAKAGVLLAAGSDREAVGRCGQPALFFAINNLHTPMLRWLLEQQFDIERADEFGGTSLMETVEHNNAEAVSLLLEAGVNVNRQNNGGSALTEASSKNVAEAMLNAGADPKDLKIEGQRVLLGFSRDPDADLLGNSREEFLCARTRRFGSQNPETMNEPFWLAMIRAGVNGFTASELFDGPSSYGGTPVWCAQRFGQTLTYLQDGRIVQIGGEHEDSYDPDFCIYNDVFVHGTDHSITIFGYPEDVFAPTDFHTATLVDNFIYVIGGLGYWGKRVHGKTMVYQLDTQTFSFSKVATTGDLPGWIYDHCADRISPDEIRVHGGTIVAFEQESEEHRPNLHEYVFNLASASWRKRD